MSSGRVGYTSSNAFLVVATSQSVVEWFSIEWSRAVSVGLKLRPSSLIAALWMSCVIESIGSDQVVDERNELVHRRAPEVVLSQLRGLH